MLMVLTTLVVAVACFYLGFRFGIQKAENQFNSRQASWYVRPHTEKTRFEFGLEDDPNDDRPIIVQAGFVRANAPGNNSRMK